MSEPLVHTIEVPCEPAEAFAVFMEMGTWWPTQRFATSVMRGSSVARIAVEARDGGRIVEVAGDGAEHVWGTVRSFEPPNYLRMDFHVPHPSEVQPGSTIVEVRFSSVGPGRTRVELTQTGWEGLGAMGAMAQKGYRSAWAAILGAYRTACGG